jgi:divergent polysaccharide deacetylase
VSATVPGTGEASSRRAVTGVRLLWLCAAITLIVAGLALAYFSPPPNQSQTNVVDVPLPPASAGKTSVLTPAPDPALVEASPNGPLPIIGKDGRQPWQVYARPFDTKDSRPRIALIVTGIGLDQTLSKGALDRLPDAITFGFDPYAGNVKDHVATARSLGHEALLGLPLEPLDYPRQDPGPLTLLTSLDPSLNADRLMTLMGKASGYVGFVAIMGARFERENSRRQAAREKHCRAARGADEAALGGRQQRDRQRERSRGHRSGARGIGGERETRRRRARHRRAVAGAARPHRCLASLAR